MILFGYGVYWESFSIKAFLNQKLWDFILFLIIYLERIFLILPYLRKQPTRHFWKISVQTAYPSWKFAMCFISALKAIIPENLICSNENFNFLENMDVFWENFRMLDTLLHKNFAASKFRGFAVAFIKPRN